jgi:hypothetical protein
MPEWPWAGQRLASGRFVRSARPAARGTQTGVKRNYRVELKRVVNSLALKPAFIQELGRLRKYRALLRRFSLTFN